MAIPKVMGIETEYVIITKGGDGSNPILASSVLINAYASPRLKRVRWDYDEETPLRDARGFERAALEMAEEDTSLVSVILENGARYYVDHAHPEYSTPEVTNARDLVIHDKAGERVLESSMEAASREILKDGERILVYKNNSDGKGNSYGTHENYLMDRKTLFPNIVRFLMPHLVTRQIYTGAGKIGVENDPSSKIPYQISQRADFFEVEVGLETTFKRPLINTRDEPHADPEKYRRLHVILGDANMSEIAGYLKVGVTAIVLRMIEDEFIAADISLDEPVASLRRISQDPTCKITFRLSDGRSINAVEHQWEIFDWAKKYLAQEESSDVDNDVMERWERVLTALETDPSILDRQLDWVAKLRILDAYRERHSLSWDDPKLALVDLQYHDVRVSKGLYNKLVQQGHIETLVTEEEITTAMSTPPEDTRAWFRGRVLQRFSKDITAASWDGVVFDVDGDTLHKVPTLEPLRGTKARVEDLIAAAPNASALLQAISG